MVHDEWAGPAIFVPVPGQLHQPAVDGPKDPIPPAENQAPLWLIPLLQIVEILSEEDTHEEVHQARVVDPLLSGGTIKTKVV